MFDMSPNELTNTAQKLVFNYFISIDAVSLSVAKLQETEEEIEAMRELSGNILIN